MSQENDRNVGNKRARDEAHHFNSSQFMVKSPAQQRNLRRSYKAILNTTAEFQEVDISEVDTKAMGKVIKKTKKLKDQIDNVQDALLDGQVVKELVGVTIAKLSSLTTNTVAFTNSGFASKLESYFNDNPVRSEEAGSYKFKTRYYPLHQHYQKLGREFTHCFKTAPGLTFLLGSFPVSERCEAAVKKPRQSKKADDKEGAATQTIDNVDDIPETGAALTELYVKSTYKQLLDAYECNDRCAVPYFEFIIHPSSFTQSVENIFHLSFLIKENRAEILLRDGVPYVEPRNEASRRQSEKVRKEEKEEKHQAVMNLTVEEHELLVKLFNIEKPRIIHDLKAIRKQAKKAKMSE